MNKLILTDVDGVLLNWYSSFQDYVETIEASPEVERAKEQIENGEFIEHSYVVDDFHAQDHVLNLKPFSDAVEVLSELDAKGYKFIAITHMDDCYHSNRWENLSKYFGDAIIGLHHSFERPTGKDFYLKDYAPTFWIEDNHKNAEAGLKYQHKPFLMDKGISKKPNISNHPAVINVESWYEIFDYIINWDS